MRKRSSDKREIPPGFKLRYSLSEHKEPITCLAWSPDGQIIASTASDGTAILWEARMGEPLQRLKVSEDKVSSVAWAPSGQSFCTASADKTLRLWDTNQWEVIGVFEGHGAAINQVSWSSNGQWLASASDDRSIRLWEAQSFRHIATLKGNGGAVSTVSWSPDARMLASGGEDGIIRIWDVESIRILRTFEGHAQKVECVVWAPDGHTLASIDASGFLCVWDTHGRLLNRLEHNQSGVGCPSFSHDGLVLAIKGTGGMVFWRYDTLEQLAFLAEPSSATPRPEISFHPSLPAFASSGDEAINIWEYDPVVLLGTAPVSLTKTYTTAKVVIVGDSGVGKTGLTYRLIEDRFVATESTHALQVWRLEVERDELNGVEREILLWDLAGQPDYRIVHQLFLDDIALGILMFDPTSSDEPFRGVEYWNNALQRVNNGKPCQRILVAGRVDVGGPTVTTEEIYQFCQAHGFAEFIATSAKTGSGVDALRAAIKRHIPWGDLVMTSAPALWVDLRQYLLRRSNSGDVLTLRSDLISIFRQKYPQVNIEDQEFDIVLSRMQAQGLIWLLPQGDFVLLQPERLLQYASVVILAARRDPKGLGSIPIQKVLAGEFDFAGLEHLKDRATERAILHAVVELLLNRELALIEGEHLIFPAVLNRERQALPDQPAGEVAYSFAGNIEEIYATLVVRLSYSRAFELNTLWKNAAEFTDLSERKCGLFVEIIGEGQGRIIAFFDAGVSIDNKTLFLRYIHEHLSKRVSEDSIRREPIYRCPTCGEEVLDRRAVEIRLQRGRTDIPCQYCSTNISLVDRLEAGMQDEKLVNRVQELEQEVEKNKERILNIATGRRGSNRYDVFICYSREDAAMVENVARSLKEHGVRPWLDVWEIKAGDSWLAHLEETLSQIKTAAVFVGGSNLRPWQQPEIAFTLEEFARRDREIIPVALPGCKKFPKLPLFLTGKSWIDYRELEPEALDQLVWRITGTHYRRIGGQL